MNFLDVTNQITGSLLAGRLSLWVGAGISHDNPSGLPLADELKFYLLDELCSDPDLRNRLLNTGDLRTKISAYPLEATLQLISNHRNILNTIAELFSTGSPNKNHLLIARLMQRGFLKDVLTTNVDLLIEQALKKEWRKGVDFDVVTGEGEFNASNPSRPIVYKIHGSADNLSSLRVTLDLVASRNLSRPRADLLQSFMSSEGELLVLGYGARDEFDINPILRGISSKKRVFFVDHKPGKREVRDKLPDPFRALPGVTIQCLTDEIVNRIWELLKEEPEPLGELGTKDWKTIVKEWADHVPESNQFFIMALVLHSVQGFEEARKAYTQAKFRFERQDDLGNLAACLHQLAMIAQHFGQMIEAENLYRESMHINEKVGNKLAVALDLHQLGLIAQQRGDQGTEGLYRRSLELKLSLGSQGEIYLASTLHQLAVLAVFRTDYDEATRLCKEALELREKFGDQLGVADSYSLLGDIALLRGEESLKAAESHHRKSLEIRKILVDQKGIAQCLHELAVISLFRGDWIEAKRLMSQSLRSREEIGDREGVGLAKAELGKLFESIGELKEAERFFLEAWQIFSDIGNVPLKEKSSSDLERIREKMKTGNTAGKSR